MLIPINGEKSQKIFFVDKRLMVKVKRYIVCLLLAVGCVPAMGQSALSVGVRGGGQMWLPKAADESTVVKSTFGGAGMLDVRYAYYDRVAPMFQMGLTVGAAAGYGGAGFQGTNTANFTNTDYLGNKMEYSTTAAFRQSETFLRTDFSLMLAIRAGGFVANIGPRVMLPFMASPTLTINEANIQAYYPKYNVTIENELITGMIETPYHTKISNQKIPMSLLVGAEVGYEFPIGDHALGVQAYADFGLWSGKESVNDSGSRLIEVKPIAESGPAEVKVNPEGLVASRRMVDFGVRVYISFNVGGEPMPDEQPARDTREHHNRYLGYK